MTIVSSQHQQGFWISLIDSLKRANLNEESYYLGGRLPILDRACNMQGLSTSHLDMHKRPEEGQADGC
jgi:hypothetical protein